MERSLRNRLTFGPLMLLAVFALLFLDNWVEKHSFAHVRDAGHLYGVGGVGLMALRVKHALRPDGQIRFEGSTGVILMILLVVKFTDIGAFFGGRALGRRKLIPWLSPGKTWEGLLCGILTAGLIGMACATRLQ